MLRRTALNPMAHLICAGHSRLELADILVTFRKAGVENLMALAGDAPDDPSLPAGELASRDGAGRAGTSHRRFLRRGQPRTLAATRLPPT